MTGQDWLVERQGCSQPLETQPYAAQDRPYRLYRFLTEVEDILFTIADPIAQLQHIVPCVRYLLDHSPWLALPIFPNPDTGWEVVTLYDEPDFPLTVQMVAWAAGTASPIHNHGCWGLVALIDGQERHQYWQRSHDPDRLEITEAQVLNPGEILTFLPDSIHQITALGEQPAMSFNLYGETDYQNRFEFDPVSFAAVAF
jgi:predicted metal-dependent enzyme (double-stranded beta helix superfamily)